MAESLSRFDVLLKVHGGAYAIEEYVRLHDAGEAIPPKLEQFILAAFRRKLAGESLDNAFGLTRGPGRTPGSEKLNEDRQAEVALRYIELVDGGISKADARRDVSIEFSVSEDTAKKYVNRFEALVRNALVVTDRYRSLITRATDKNVRGNN